MGANSLSASLSDALHNPQPREPEEATPFSRLLQNNEQGFFNQRNYLTSTRLDFGQKRAPIVYRYDTESKCSRYAYRFFSIILLPIALFDLLHALVGKIIVASSIKWQHPKQLLDECMLKILSPEQEAQEAQDREWVYKRITIAVDGYEIDAMIMGKPSTLNNGKWLLQSNGNDELYEEIIHECHFNQKNHFNEMLSSIESNAIFFNYPGVGSSSGMPNRKAMAKAYRAMLTFLEDSKRGIGASTIIGYGFSIGGGVQGEALRTHQLKDGIKYVFIKDRSFSDLSKVVSTLTCRLLGFLVRVLGWNISSVESSKNLEAPEIIIQSCSRVNNQECWPHDIFRNFEDIQDDGVIHHQASLAWHFLKNEPGRQNQQFLGMPGDHNFQPEHYHELIRSINACIL